jgi:hypothetical protein
VVNVTLDPEADRHWFCVMSSSNPYPDEETARSETQPHTSPPANEPGVFELAPVTRLDPDEVNELNEPKFVYNDDGALNDVAYDHCSLSPGALLLLVHA